jgi:hypothetical protein
MEGGHQSFGGSAVKVALNCRGAVQGSRMIGIPTRSASYARRACQVTIWSVPRFAPGPMGRVVSHATGHPDSIGNGPIRVWIHRGNSRWGSPNGGSLLRFGQSKRDHRACDYWRGHRIVGPRACQRLQQTREVRPPLGAVCSPGQRTLRALPWVASVPSDLSGRRKLFALRTS